MWRLRKDEKLTTLRIFICVLLVKVDVCRKRTLVTFIAAFFISIIQNTLLWGCFLPILPSKFLYSKVGLLLFPLLVVSYFVLFELDFPILLENWFLNEEKMNIWQKMRGHSRVGVDGILEEAELCRITHPMNATSNFHTWLTHSFRSSKIVILNSNKSIFCQPVRFTGSLPSVVIYLFSKLYLRSHSWNHWIKYHFSSYLILHAPKIFSPRKLRCNIS